MFVKLDIIPHSCHCYFVILQGKDALSFGLIALVFMISYGIVRGALLHPGDQVFNVLAIPYWQFYGELFLEDDGKCKI